MTETELAAFVAVTPSDAEALAPILTDQAEPASEEDRDEIPETDYPEDYGFEGPEFNPYIDDYDRWQDDLAEARYEATFWA
jgi:hypothetical protein